MEGFCPRCGYERCPRCHVCPMCGFGVEAEEETIVVARPRKKRTKRPATPKDKR